MKTYNAIVETYIEQGDYSQGMTYIEYQVTGQELELESNAKYFLLKKFGEKNNRVIYSVSNLTLVELFRLLNSVGDIRILDVTNDKGTRFYPIELVNSYGYTTIFKEKDLIKRLIENNENNILLTDYKECSITRKEYDYLTNLFGDVFQQFLGK